MYSLFINHIVHTLLITLDLFIPQRRLARMKQSNSCWSFQRVCWKWILLPPIKTDGLHCITPAWMDMRRLLQCSYQEGILTYWRRCFKARLKFLFWYLILRQGKDYTRCEWIYTSILLRSVREAELRRSFIGIWRMWYQRMCSPSRLNSLAHFHFLFSLLSRHVLQQFHTCTSDSISLTF